MDNVKGQAPHDPRDDHPVKAVNHSPSVMHDSRSSTQVASILGDQQCELPNVECYDVATVEKVYRKLDWRILPAFWTLYFLCGSIRSNIGIAQTMNLSSGHDLMTVLNLSARDTSTALALFYVAYVLFDLPSNLIMSRLSPRLWMCRIVFATGVVGACFAAVQSAWSVKLLRFLLGVVAAGMWPGMAYYLTLFYPPERIGRRIGVYFTAGQVSAAVVGLISAGFQLMDGIGGLAGFRWMFLVYGLIAIALSVALLFWLPDRPLVPGEARRRPARYLRWLPNTPEALTGHDAVVHYWDLKRVYYPPHWTVRDLFSVLLDWRLWPLLCMYFGVVGVGIGTQLYGTVIIKSITPDASSITVSLLFAPIWIMDLIAILLFTPIADRFHRSRHIVFTAAVLFQITGLIMVAFAPVTNPSARYGGLLMVGFGLGPTVPICMAWTSDVFQHRHGEVGVAAATAIVSGLGNLGSIVTTYALYTGWAEDARNGPTQYRWSNAVMIGMLVASALSSWTLWTCLNMFGNEPIPSLRARSAEMADGAATREGHERGMGGLFGIGRKQPSKVVVPAMV